jgi:WD40 repeat protein
MSLDELARASCAIYADGRREGTGTLVTDTHVLTAAHVLRRGGPLTIRFRDGLSGEAISVERLPLGADAEELDIAVLELEPGSDRPAPGKLWSAKRLPVETKAFGYPKGEGTAPRGVWRDSAVGGAVQGGRVQLDWHDVGTLEGHSGGPVCEKLSGLMAGVLVEGSDTGHFDRLVPLPAIRRVWNGLPRPWLFAGESARTHFTQRAAGQRSIARGGDLFRGRQNALAVVRGWLCAGAGPGFPLVITAQPGAGKSAVLARALLGIERTGQCDGVAFHARRAGVADLVDAVSAACGLDTPPSWQELVAALAAQEAHDVVVVAVDALDEAASDQDRVELRRALRELARLDWLRVAVATRPLAARGPYRPGTHLHGLGVLAGAASRNLVDLDIGRFFVADDLVAYADTLLAQDGSAKPGPPGGAWECYRQNEGLRGRLARVIAGRAGRNYLVAGMSAFQLAEDDKVLDPASAMFDPSDVPSGIGEALSKYLDSLPARRRRCEVGLLTALAYGRGAGLDDKRWLAFTRALGYEDVTTADLAGLKVSAAADYLLETSPEPGGLVTRLFHQALADELVAGRDRRGDESRLVQLLQAEGGRRGWLASSPYARNHAPSHAAEAGLLERVVREADFLVAMAPAAMRSAVRSLSTSSCRDPASIYDVALPFLGDDRGSNAAVLELVSRAQGNRALSHEFGRVRVRRPYKIGGHIRPFDRAMACFDGHTGGVTRVAALGWPGLDHPVVVTTSDDGTARVWDPRDPSRELARFDGHTGQVQGVATLGWPGLDHPVIVTASADGTARVWDPRDPSRELARFDGHTDWARGVATLEWPGLDHPVIVTASDDGTARVWDPRDPSRELARFDGHTGWVMKVATLRWPGLDHPVIVTASDDGTARVWDPRDPSRELARFDGHSAEVQGVAALAWPGLDHPVIVTASLDGMARVWDLRDQDRDLARFDGHTAGVWGVAALEWPGLDHPVIVTTSRDGTARVWDPRDHDRELARFDTDSVTRVAALEWLGLDHPVIVTTSADGTARVWDPRDPSRELARFDGHTGQVLDVATLGWPGLDHLVIVTTSRDGTARVWDPRDPSRELARFDGHTGQVVGVATLGWPGLDHLVIVTTSRDGTARVWDPRDPSRELARFDGHTGWVMKVATLRWPGLDHPVIVTTSRDARVWDPRRPDRELARFDGHTGQVLDVAALAWPGLDHPVIVTASLDGTARVWDPYHPHRELAHLPLFGMGHAIAVLDRATLAIASSRGFLVFELRAHQESLREIDKRLSIQPDVTRADYP